MAIVNLSHQTQQEIAIVNLPHHAQLELCKSRPPYRQGKKLTAVKVYTVNDESIHLLVNNVPAVHLHEEVCKLCVRYGDITLCTPVIGLEEQEEFTETFHIQYTRIQAARFAKRQLDGKSFFGGVLHVCYAPELETIEETRSKLAIRRHEIAVRVKQKSSDDCSPAFVKQKTVQRSKKHPTLPLAISPHVQEAVENGCTPLQVSKVVYGPLDTGHSNHSGDSWQINSRILSYTLPKELSLNETQVLRFVPRPVATPKRIVFHRKMLETKRGHDDNSEEPVVVKKCKNT